MARAMVAASQRGDPAMRPRIADFGSTIRCLFFANRAAIST